MKSQLLFLALLAITVVSQESVPSSPSQIIELFRHGARSPINNFDHSWHDYATLTPVGYRQHYILGKALAKKYPGLIRDAYKNNDIYMFSSYAPRCIQSAGAHLHGMYSDFDNEGIVLREDYPRELAIPGFQDPSIAEIAQSIPNDLGVLYNFFRGVFRIADAAGMYVFGGEQPHMCPKMGQLHDENRFDSASERMFKEFQDTVNNLNSFLHQELHINHPDNLIDYADPMFADIYDNRTLLGGLTDQVLINNITWAATWFYYHFAQGQQVQRELSAFHVVEAFVEQLDKFRKGESHSTVSLFSGHDNNLLAMLSAFGIINEECIFENFLSVWETGNVKHPACEYPKFASNIIAEFYNKTDAPSVKLLYKNIPIQICNGKYECAYEEFVVWARNAVGNNTRETYFEKCEVTAPVQGPAPLKESGHKNHIVFSSPVKKVIVTADIEVRFQTILNVILGLVCVGLVCKIFHQKKKYIKMINNRNENRAGYQQQNEFMDKTVEDI